MSETETEYCTEEWVDASWCEGPSLRECPDGRYIPEHHETCDTHIEWTPLPDCWTDELGCVGPALDQTYDPVLPGSPDPVDGDDSCTPPARGDCTLETEPPALAELPATGVEGLLLMVTVLLLVAGTCLIRGVARGAAS